MTAVDDAKAERLLTLAHDRIDGRRPGLGEPALWHLVFRRYGPAISAFAIRLTGRRMAGPFSSNGLNYRAVRMGEMVAAYNLAMDGFNRRDLAMYRHWLRKAAKMGWPDAETQLRHFETRLPRGAARDIKRCRPYRSYD